MHSVQLLAVLVFCLLDALLAARRQILERPLPAENL